MTQNELQRSPLYPTVIPDVIVSLLSNDKSMVGQTEKNLDQLVGDAKKESADFDYLSNVIFLIHGKVSDILGQQAKLQQKAADFEAINEEGVIAVGVVISAVATAPNLEYLAIASASGAAVIKLLFSFAKWFYNRRQSAQIQHSTDKTLRASVDESAAIFHTVYKQQIPPASLDKAKTFTTQKALMFARKSI